MKIFSNKLKSNEGFFTLEAVIVFTTMFFVLLVLIFMGLFLYQQVRLQTLAQKSASRGAMIYNIASRDMYIGRVSLDTLNDSDPYRFIVDSKQGARTARVQEYLDREILSKNVVSQVSNTKKTLSAKADVDNYLIVKKTVVDINSEYIVPIGGIFKLFGIQSPFKITAHSEAMVQEPAEFIRNLDICGDVLKYADKQVLDGKTGEAINPIVVKLKGFIQKFRPESS